MKVVWLRRTLWHLSAIRRYISEDNPTAALTMLQRIYESSNRLEVFPEIGRVGRAPGTRELPIMNSPYVVVYKIGHENVEILAVFHSARRCPTYFSK